MIGPVIRRRRMMDRLQKRRRTAAATPARRRSRAKISGPEAISALGYSMVDGRTRLGEEFSKADTFRFRARAQLNNEIQRSHELTNDEKFNLSFNSRLLG